MFPGLFAAGIVSAAGGVVIDDSGNVLIDGIKFQPCHYTVKWQPAGVNEKNFAPEVQRAKDKVSFAGKWNVANGTLELKELFARNGQSWDADYSVSAETPVPTGSLVIVNDLPAELFDNGGVFFDRSRRAVFPAGKKAIATRSDIITFVTPNGKAVVTGKNMLIQLTDYGRSAGKAVSIRIWFDKKENPLKSNSLKLNYQFLPDAAAAAAPGAIAVQPDGAVKVGGMQFAPRHFAPGWNATSANQYTLKLAGETEQGDGRKVVAGEWKVRNGSLQLESRFTFAGKNKVFADYSVRSEKGVPTLAMVLAFDLPGDAFEKNAIVFDNNRKASFPAGKTSFATRFNTMEIPLAQGKLVVTGEKLLLQVMDGRRGSSKDINFRIYFTAREKELKNDKLKVTFEFVPYREQAVDLSRSANMGFTDEVADDRKGGWSDQGPSNDMRYFPGGKKLNANGVNFYPGDEKKANTVIALKGTARQYFPESATVELKDNTKVFSRIYLLNGCAWSSASPVAGTVEVAYKSGKKDSFTLNMEKETGNFWGPRDLDNAEIGWKGDNNSSKVVLYSTSFPLQASPVESIKLIGNGKAIWLIAGITLSDRPSMAGLNRKKQVSDKPVVFTASKDWIPIKDSKIRENTVLDFSFLNHKPAGIYGRAAARGDRFVFEKKPDQEIRFYGSNVCSGANVPSKENAVFVARDLARRGYNFLRLHHFDNQIIRRSGDYTELDPEKMDRFDYFVSELKKNGIYVSADLYISRVIGKEALPGCPRDASGHFYKVLCHFWKPALDNLKKFSANLLNHVNPYTGMAYKDDPQWVGVNFINEDTINFHMAEQSKKDFLKERIDEAFAKYCKERNLPNDKKHFNGFLETAQRNLFNELKTLVRGLGSKIQVCDQNMCWDYNTSVMRDHYDFVDNHAYFGHPSFMGGHFAPPMRIEPQDSAIPYAMATFSYIAVTRYWNKPFTVSEWCFCHPNYAAGEASLLLSTYASMQGWNGLNRFAYSHVGDKAYNAGDSPRTCFDDVHDPLVRIGEQLGAWIFRTYAVKKLPGQFVAVLDKNLNFDSPQILHTASRTRSLALLGRIGCITVPRGENAKLPENTIAVIPHGNVKVADKVPSFEDDNFILQNMAKQKLIPQEAVSQERFASPTGETVFDIRKSTFVLTAPRIEAFVMQQDTTLDGKYFSAKAVLGYGTTAVISLDEKPLEKSQKMLVFHIFDLRNTNQRFRDGNLNIMEKWGKVPMLAQRSTMEITSKRDLSGYELTALALDGTELKKIPFKNNRLILKNIQKEGIVAVYLLSKKQ